MGGLFKEFWLFIKTEKIWWMAPLIIILLGIGALILFTSSGSALAPFLYPLF